MYRHFTGRTLWTLFRGLRASTLLAAIPLPSWLLLGVPDALLYRLLLSDKVLHVYVYAVKSKHVTQLLTFPYEYCSHRTSYRTCSFKFCRRRAFLGWSSMA